MLRQPGLWADEPQNAATAQARLLAVLARVQDPEIGLIRRLFEVPLQPSEPDLYVAVAEFLDPFALRPGDGSSGRRDVVTQSSGAGVDRLSALWAAVGEAIERYALHAFDPQVLVFAPAMQLDAEYLSIDDLILFADEQYRRGGWPYVRFNPAQPIHWVRARRLDTGAAAYVPASLVYLGFGVDGERFDAGYSTGAAAGSSFAEAALAGLLETVERDGFACHWYLRRTPAKVDREAVMPQLPPRIRHLLAHASLRLQLLDITTDIGISTALVVGRTRNGCGIPIGAAARLTFEDALAKAAVEAFHTYNWILDLRRRGEFAPTRTDIRTFRDHVRFYFEPANARCVDFLFAHAAPTAFAKRSFAGATVEECLEALVRHLVARGHRCFAVDITPPELDGLALRVVKSFITGVHPLGCGYGHQHLDPRRLHAFACAAGIPAHITVTLNEDPHPFP